MWPFVKKEKWKSYITKGDAALNKGKPKDALKYYKKALKFNNEEASIFSKLIAARESIDEEWSQEDFVEFMEWSLAEQGHENPGLKQVYARLSPEWKETWELAMGLFSAEGNEIPSKIEELVSRGGISVRVLSDIIIQFASYSQNKTDEADK